MRSLNSVIGFVFGVMMLGGTCFADAPNLTELRQQWLAGKYQVVIPKLVEIWKQNGGRTWEVDYMIGTSACRAEGLRSNGVAFLEDSLTFQMNAQMREASKKELEDCRGRASNEQAARVSASSPVITQIASIARVAGKGGYEFRPDATKAASSSVLLTPVPIADLARRLVPLESAPGPAAKLVVESATARLPDISDSATNGRFVVVSSGKYIASYTASCLTQYEQILSAEFGMKLPPNYITVYAMDSVTAVSDASSKLHGVPLPLGTVAYSVFDDLSMTGLADGHGCGTLAHELVHLMIRSNFGNAPAWLEEGLACEVAVTYPGSTSFQFNSSWRDEVLRTRWNLRPKVAGLLDADWSSYSATTVSAIEKVAATNAMAASFIRYLSDKKQLDNIYVAFRDQRFSRDLTKRNSDRELLETALGMKLDAVDADFAAWFGNPKGTGAPAMKNNAPMNQQSPMQQQAPMKAPAKKN